MADETPVTATVGNGGLTPSDPGAVEEWLALMPPYGGRVSGRAVCPFRRGVASSEAETFCFPEAGSLPSSEAEARGAVEGFGGEPSSEAEITPRVRGGCERAALSTWAACWASLSPFLSSRLEGGCRPSWAWLPSMCLRFKAVLVP